MMTRLLAGHLVVAAAVAMFAWPSAARADDAAKALFEDGNRAYLEGSYEEAAQYYAQILTQHELDDPALYLNLGNAYFRLERYGSAIFFYRRGLRLDPGAALAEQLDRNLKATRRRLQERYRASGESKAFIYTEPGGLLYRITHIFSGGTTVTMFLLLWAVFFALLMWRRLRTRDKPSGTGPVTGVIGVLAVIFGLLLWGQVYTDNNMRLGVVIEQNVTLKEGKHPDAKGEPLREGVEVRIVESDEEWARVRRSDGAEGWVEARAVKQI